MKLDAGTTYSTFPPSVHNVLMKTFTKYCSARKNRCGGYQSYQETSCFNQDKSVHNSLDSFFSSFPTLRLSLGKSGIYKWRPADYLAVGSNPYDASGVTYCNGLLKSTDEQTAILGSTFMHNHEIFFDRPNSRVQIVETGCD